MGDLLLLNENCERSCLVFSVRSSVKLLEDSVLLREETEEFGRVTEGEYVSRC